MSIEYKSLHFEELEDAILWLNTNEFYKLDAILSTPKGIYIVYETHNNND